MTTATRPADAREGVPAWLALVRDYFTLTKPTIILLLLITTLPAMVLAADGWPGTGLVLATLLGGIMAAGGASAVNMYIDRDIDALMTRTRSRPIPRGAITPRHAAIFGWALGIASAPWLIITVNMLSAVLAVSAFLFYVLAYSLYLKRHTVHNTVVGGIAGAAPPLIGWTAVTGELSREGLLLFLIVFFWQPAHFWALALRLSDEYRAANIPMMPVVLGEQETKRQTLIYAVLTGAITIMFGAAAELSWLYFAVASVGAFGFIALAWRLLRGGSEMTLWRYSTLYLAAVFAAMVADQLLLG